MIEQTLFSERDDWREKELKLNTKNNEHDNKLKDLDYSYNEQMRNTLER